MSSAAQARGYFVGDYEAVGFGERRPDVEATAGPGDAFKPFFGLANGATANPPGSASPAAASDIEEADAY